MNSGYLMENFYNGQKQSIVMKFFDPETKSIFLVDDPTGHKPYCLTNLTDYELSLISKLVNHAGFDHIESISKIDPLSHQSIPMSKIFAKDPLSIGSLTGNDIRTIVPSAYPRAKIWESNIKYHQSYVYDRDLIMGLQYRIKDNTLYLHFSDEVLDKVESILNKFKLSYEEEKVMRKWLLSLECPVPHIPKVALDIEVWSPVPNRVPDPHRAAYPVIAVSLRTSDGRRIIFLWKRNGIEMGPSFQDLDCEVAFFEYEVDLIKEVFKFLDYPLVITFNGDNFDLKYLCQRARNLEIEDIPIVTTREKLTLTYGIHLDLYRFFKNRSIKIYAFKSKYLNDDLNSISLGLLGKGKIPLDKTFGELTYHELAEYCLNDTDLTYELTDFDNELVMKLVVILMRIANLTLEDVSRLSVSQWIRSFMYHEHRKRGYVIPWVEDIKAKGKIQTKAVIKGKKYKGAIVIEAPSGIFFLTDVLDFASLYPTVIKVKNLGYTSINCEHEECKSNLVPETTHWICTKRQAMTSLLIGTLRDVRVEHYKKEAKRKDIPAELKSFYSVIEQAIKVILNASYGVFGSLKYDLYCPPVAESITAISRWAIEELIKKAQSMREDMVLYGDTDSIFLNNPSDEEKQELIEWAEKFLKLDLEVDKSYKWVIFSARKKNYIGKMPDGDLDIKGMTGKKKHIPIIIKNSFNEMKEKLKEIETLEDFEKAKRDIISITKSIYSILKTRKWENIADLSFHIGLGKNPDAYKKTTPQHVKAARMLEEATDREFVAGDIISFVKTTEKVKKKRGGYKYVSSVRPLELAKPEEIDVNKYIEQVKSTFAPVCEPMNIDFESDIQGITKLEAFM